jgi:hypothetical protein
MNVISEIAALPLIAPRPRQAQTADRRGAERRTSSRPPVATESERRLRNERRAWPRQPVEVECEELVDGLRHFRVTRDLSVFGLSTRFGHPLQLGTRFELILHLPDDRARPLRLWAQVVGWNLGGAGMRLAFRQPSSEAVRRIAAYLRSRR